MSEGRQVAGYLLQQPIGSGGMGEVWLARHEILGRLAVLKKLRRELASVEELSERFEREARTAAAVHDRNVVVVYDAFRFRGDLYLAQEYVDGADLRSVLDRFERLPPRLAVHVALELARGLEAIHAVGTVHRDLKPANLLISREGEVKLTDFGVALEQSGPALTQSGVVVGTPAYLSPEQLAGERADARSDLFAFGVLLYELLTGKTPYPESDEPDSPSRLARMQRERYAAPRKLCRDVPRGVARAVKSCLRARPAQRPASAAELRRALERCGVAPSDRAAGRGELAAWLWERGMFERRADETVIALAPTAAAERARPLRALLAAGIVLAIGLASAGFVDVDLSAAALWVQRLAASVGVGS
jgi:eukaryotic-like serine/threonine-protein kinase